MEKDLGRELKRCETSKFWIYVLPIFFLGMSLYFFVISLLGVATADTVMLTLGCCIISISFSFKEKYELVLYEKGIKATKWTRKKKSVTVCFLFSEIEFLSYAVRGRNRKSVDLWSDDRNRRTTILNFFIIEMKWHTFVSQLESHYSQCLKEHCPQKFKNNDFFHDVHEAWNGELWDRLKFFDISKEID